MLRSLAAPTLVAAFLPVLASAGTSAPSTAPGHDADPRVDAWVLATPEGQTTEFLVELAVQADVSGAAAISGKADKGRHVSALLSSTAAATQGPILDLLRALGVPHQSYWIANVVWVRAGADVARLLASRGDVAHVHANPWVKLRGPAAIPLLPAGGEGDAPRAVEWNILRVGAPTLWGQGFTGQGSVIAGADTGYQWNHPALRDHYRGWNGSAADHDYNWHDAIHSGGGSCGANTTAPCDDYGHGTHTMGTMVGDDGGSNQIGMAPGSRWIGCRNMDQGFGTPATYTECFQFFIAPTDLNGQNPDPSLAPHVVNNSWGCLPSEGCTSPNLLKTIVENTRAAGIVVVVSAGNSGSSCSTVMDPPAIYDASFSVGATDFGDSIASFSSRGPVTIDGSGRLKPDISAPGDGVRSSYPGNGYGALSGTSMAGPHVAGHVALLISREPALAGQVDALEQRIVDTALSKSTNENCGGTAGDIPNNTYGWGRIQAGCPIVTLSPSTLPNGQIGQSYSQSLSASGGTPTYRYLVIAGSLPPGLALSSAGVLSGTPTIDGSFPFTVQVKGSDDCGASRGYTMVVDPAGCPTITLSPATLPNATEDQAYSQTITASGGSGPYTFTVITGALPPGLALATTGLLSGTPTAPGVYPFTVSAEDAGSCTGTQAYTLVVDPASCPSITLSPTTLPPATEGQAYSQTITASGGSGPYSFSVVAGTLPSGLTLATSGLLSGTPSAAGSSSFTVEAQDGAGCAGTQAYTLVVNPAGCPTITLTPSSLPAGIIGQPYAQTIGASGGTAPYTFAVTQGAPPPGVTLSAGGVLSGTPSATGTFAFTVTATDADACTGAAPYSIVVGPGGSRVDHVVGEGAGAPNANRVRVFTGAGVATGVDLFAYGAGAWGTMVGSADVDGAPYAEILTGPGPGPMFGPQVRAFLRDGTSIAKVSFYAYGTLRYGVNVAGGDVDADSFAELITGAGPGQVFGPHVRGFDYDGAGVQGLAKLSFYAYGTPRYGVNAASGSVESDAFAEVITGAGPGVVFGAQVRGFDYDGATVAAIPGLDFFAFSTAAYGVNVGAGDTDADGVAEIAAAPGPGSSSSFPARFRGFDYDGSAVSPMPGFDVLAFASFYGGRVGAADVSNDGKDDLLAGAGPSPSADSTVNAYDYDGFALIPLAGGFVPFGTDVHGVNVAGGALDY